MLSGHPPPVPQRRLRSSEDQGLSGRQRRKAQGLDDPCCPSRRFLGLAASPGFCLRPCAPPAPPVPAPCTACVHAPHLHARCGSVLCTLLGPPLLLSTTFNGACYPGAASPSAAALLSVHPVPGCGRQWAASGIRSEQFRTFPALPSPSYEQTASPTCPHCRRCHSPSALPLLGHLYRGLSVSA